MNNQSVTKKIVAELKAMTPETPVSLIQGTYLRVCAYYYIHVVVSNNGGSQIFVFTNLVYTHLDAARTYFTSLCGKEHMQESGKYFEKCASQRKKNRLDRVSAL